MTVRDQTKILGRPGAKGDPDQLDAGPTLPKPLTLIPAPDPSALLRLSDRKLINVLLAFSWNSVLKSDGPFDVAAIRVRKAMGQRTQHKNRELRASLERLCSTPVSITAGDKTVQVPILEHFDLPSRSTQVVWSFAPPVLDGMRDPKPWSKLRLDVCARFERQTSLILYELLAAYPDRRYPWVRYQLDELRASLSVRPESYPDWSDLRKRTLGPAVEDINKLAGFRVKARPEQVRGSRRVVSVLFDCTQPKSKSR